MYFGSHNLVVAQVEEFDDSRTNLVSTGHLCRIDILAVQQWLTPFVEKDTREAKRAKETISKSFSTFVVMDSELSPDHHHYSKFPQSQSRKRALEFCRVPVLIGRLAFRFVSPSGIRHVAL